MFVIGHFAPRSSDYVMPVNESMDVTPWEFRFEASAVILYMVLGAYIMFSKVGFVSDDPTFMQVYGLCGVVMLVGVAVRYFKKKQARSKC